MIVAFDATAIGSHLGGDETLVSGLLRGLVEWSDPQDRIEVLGAEGAQLPGSVLASEHVWVEYVRRRGGTSHFGRVLPWWLAGLARRGMRPDAVVTNTHAPLFTTSPVALMVPDLSFEHLPDAYPPRTRMRLQQVVRRQVRSAAVVLTISEFSQDDLVRTYGLPPDRVHVVPLVPDPPLDLDPQAAQRLTARGVRHPFVLYLGNLHPRKNVPRLIRAFLQAREKAPTLGGHQIVIAGRPWFGGTAEREAAARAPEDAVLFLDRVDDAEREVLLRQTEALAYVSTFEGFGLPPLESMARGTPVLASDVTSIPEVCRGAAVLVDPTDDAAIVDGLVSVLTDHGLRERLVDAGHARAGEYHVQRTGEALLDALRSISSRHPSPAGRLG